MKKIESQRVLVIARGIPGSGKSTFAELLAESEYICTADDYHMKEGKYEWKLENIKMSHIKCQKKCRTLMETNIPLIVIANTSTTTKELKPYYDLATAFKYKVFSVIVENRHEGKNSHNVPEQTLKKMIERFSIKLI
jgi:predicted kinase